MLTFYNLHFKGVLRSNSSSTPAHKALCVDLLSLGAVLVLVDSGEQDRPGCPLLCIHHVLPLVSWMVCALLSVGRAKVSLTSSFRNIQVPGCLSLLKVGQPSTQPLKATIDQHAHH